MRIKQAQGDVNRTSFMHMIEQLGIKSNINYHGQLCGLSRFEKTSDVAHIHLIRKGDVTLISEGGSAIQINSPSVIFFPRAITYLLDSPFDEVGVAITTAEISYAIGQNNLLIDAFQSVMVFELAQWPFLLSIIDIIDNEQQFNKLGGTMICNQLISVFVVYLLRQACEESSSQPGIIALLSHKHFGLLVEQIFADISYPWQIKNMAQISCMSRANFAKEFKIVSGQTPNEFLSHIRVQSAKRGLQQGQSIQYIANHIGYSSISALNKLFGKYVGMSPKQWVNDQI